MILSGTRQILDKIINYVKISRKFKKFYYKSILDSKLIMTLNYELYFLLGKSITVELVGKQVRVSQDMAIFITMNPGYAGRSNLPDNLKKLFRSLAMTTPDRQLIAEVMLFSQGFRTAEKLACKIVPFFK